MNPKPAPKGNGVSAEDPGQRLKALDWPGLVEDLWAHGAAVTPPVLTEAECAELATLFEDDARFRKRIDMARYRFGKGHYAYFAEPLPPLVAALRGGLYHHLAPTANDWAEALRRDDRFPEAFGDYQALCRKERQVSPTPLLLRYGEGDYNRLHQDLYGPLNFPFQAVCLLSKPVRDFSGGEFMLVSQPPRQQGIGDALAPGQGALVIFPCRERPFPGKRGWLRATVRHGVSRITRGNRTTLGLIFHDAQ